MNYYQHHIGDYRRDTAHLSLLEHGVYRQLLDMYYLSEAKIPAETEVVYRRLCARTEDEKKAVDTVLSEFFKLENGWIQTRCDKEIAEYHGKAGRARENGKLGGRPSKTKEVISDNPEATKEKANHKPLTTNQEPLTTNQDKDLASSKLDAMQCPAEKIVDAYHRLMPENPKCKVLNSARRGAIKARWNEAAKLDCVPFGYSTAADGLEAWENFFEICSTSAFLTGKAKPQPGKPPFFADIDFLMSPAAFAKCLENKYHRDAP